MDKSKPITILVADDDADDRMLIKEAFIESKLTNELNFVTDGVELMEYLRHEGKYQDRVSAPRPGLILLDLNMPRMDGREALSALKDDPHLKNIPVVVLTTSRADEDILRTYDLGVSSYISKPVSFEGLLEVVKVLSAYWIQIVELPRSETLAA